MKKISLVIAFVIALSAASFAQKGNNQIGVAAEVGIPLGDFGKGTKTGFGGSVRGLYGVGTAGQITLTSGYTTFTEKESTDDDKATLGIIPILAGYRQNFSGFYVEPQAGLGIYSVKVKFAGQSESESNSGFTYAVGVGYAKSGLDIGARIQSASVKGETFSLVGFHVGYNFSLGGSSKE